MTDIVDDVEQLIQADVLAMVGPDPSGELAAMALPELLITYFNWRARQIVASPRHAHLSAELLASAKYQEHRSGVVEIARKFEVGEDLTPHLRAHAEIDWALRV